jgi:hypothetical protein
VSGDGIWIVSFMHYHLGYIDLAQKTLQPLDNPFGPGLSPMSEVRSVPHVPGPDKCDLAEGEELSSNPFFCKINGLQTTQIPLDVA